jgi:hypothetical protein
MKLWHRDPWRTRRTPHDRDAHDGTLELVAACGIVGLCLLVSIKRFPIVRPGSWPPPTNLFQRNCNDFCPARTARD